MTKRSLLAVAAFMALPTVLPAALVVSYNAPNSQFTTVPSTSQYNFDTNATGLSASTTWAGVGSFTNLYVTSANTFGGSNGTQYAVVGTPSTSLSTVLTFTAPEAYFGFEWLAIDSQNSLTITYSGGGSQTFNSISLNAALGACPGGPYCGNPVNRTNDPNENFAYVNFTGTNGTKITSVTFGNADYSTGFEFDSLAVTTTSQTPPGTVLPEPFSMSLTLSGLGVAGYLGRKRLRKA